MVLILTKVNKVTDSYRLTELRVAIIHMDLAYV